MSCLAKVDFSRRQVGKMGIAALFDALTHPWAGSIIYQWRLYDSVSDRLARFPILESRLNA